MPKRSYKTKEEIAGDLERLLISLRERGEGFIPSERVLCSEVGASRETVRRVLEDFEARGMLIAGSKKGRALAISKKTGPKVVFTATGVGAIGNMTWARVWNALSKLAESSDLSLSLALTEKDREDETLAPILENPPDCLVLADCASDGAKDKIGSLRGRSTIICVDMQYEGLADYVVCLDNFAAGLKAGRAILAAGYRNPCYIAWRQEPEYRPFSLRAEGFMAALDEAGFPPAAERLQWAFAERNGRVAFIVALIRVCERIAASSFDSLFYHSDEELDFVYQIISERRRIPDDFGLISMIGRGQTFEGLPPVDAINQAETKVAKGVFDLLGLLRSGREPERRIQLMEPEVKNVGKTLRR